MGKHYNTAARREQQTVATTDNQPTHVKHGFDTF